MLVGFIVGSGVIISSVMDSDEGHVLSDEQLAEGDGNAELDQVILVNASCHKAALKLDLEWELLSSQVRSLDCLSETAARPKGQCATVVNKV